MTGWPVTTIVRGKCVVRDGELVGDKSHGEHLARDRSPYAKPRGVSVSGFEPAGSGGLNCRRAISAPREASAGDGACSSPAGQRQYC